MQEKILRFTGEHGAVFILENVHLHSIRIELTQDWKSLNHPEYSQRLLSEQMQMLEWHKHTYPDTYIRYADIEFEVVFTG